jgi:glutamyl-tRNA synthetase
MSKDQVICRFAPSPTGKMHIGNLRIALFSWLYAKQNNGKFILRIEDTDQVRSQENYVSDIKHTLELFGLSWDEFYQQSKRLPYYSMYALLLVAYQHAYFCTCPKDSQEECKCRNKSFIEQQSELKNGFSIKLKINQNETIHCYDELRQASIPFSGKELYDIVLLKRDSTPTYHLASVVDDHLMGITDIFRGDEWLSSLPYHKILYSSLGWEMPRFYHLPLILDSKGNKLSKRENHFAVEDLLKKYLPCSILNYIALLGWDHSKLSTNFLTTYDLLKQFDINKLSNNASHYDEKLLRKLNLKHSKTEEGINQYFKNYNNLDINQLHNLLPIYQSGIGINELIEEIDRHIMFGQLYECQNSEELKFFKMLLDLISKFCNSTYYNSIYLTLRESEKFIWDFKDVGYNNKTIHELIRVAITGKKKGLPAENLLSIVDLDTLITLINRILLHSTIKKEVL